jgi:hypothetical protein
MLLLVLVRDTLFTRRVFVIMNVQHVRLLGRSYVVYSRVLLQLLREFRESII